MIRVATVSEDLDREGAIAAELSTHRDAELVLRCVDRVELLAAIRGGNLDALIVVEHVAWFDRQCGMEASRAGVRVVSVTDDAPVIGSSAVVDPRSSLDEILTACESAAPSSLPEPVDPGTGRLTAVWGPKGSPGRTRVAVELALELATTGIEAALIDGDPYGGDALQTLGVVDELPNLVWAARMAGKAKFDVEEVRCLRRVGSGVVLIPGLPRSDLWADVSDFGYRELLLAARRLFDHTICDVGFCLESDLLGRFDGSEGRNRLTRSTLTEADRVVAVCEAQPIGLKNFLWAYQELIELVDPDRIVIIANKVLGGSEREISELLRRETGKRPTAYLPDRPEIARSAVLEGVSMTSLKGTADVRAAIQALAISLGARVQPSGVLTKLGGKAR